MYWGTQMLGFGVLAFALFVLSAVCARRKKAKLGLLFGGLGFLSAIISSAAGVDALILHEKIDWFLLDLFSYTPIALTFYIMLLASMVCIGVNLGRIVKQRANGGE